MSSSTNGLVRGKGLREKQERALAALRGGSSFPQAAQAAGVGRATVYRWMQSDPHFRAAYNAWQQEQAESASSRLLKLADQAVDVVEKALVRGDEKVAVGVLKSIGAMRRPQRGATDPQVLKLQMQLQRERDKYKACEGMVRHLLTKAGLTAAEQRQYIREHSLATLAKQLPSAQKLLSDVRLASVPEAKDEADEQDRDDLLGGPMDDDVDETIEDEDESLDDAPNETRGETPGETAGQTPRDASHSKPDAAAA